MSRCELTGKSPITKNLVSHSNIKTKKKAMPNVQNKRIFSRSLNQMVRLHIAASALRDMEHVGGFDAFIMKMKDATLSKRALAVKLRILKKIGATKAKVLN
ncbi:MAG: 50S ribosomal protein L28 [Bdellovibrionales bacterium]|jgi:large subunit ribosomal protein L28|nr:50S ribosomal protein L28 [Bdellovibrionales bacterium]MBL7670897.1 50S ribosomal protein L28 [Pseudobdellovibrionaceae bacterium]